MLNFTVGPVQMNEEILQIGAEQIPYFRTPEFSEIMKENESLMKKFVFAEQNARVLYLTSSGTGAMEAAVMNVLTKQDNVLVVNGGGFGQRFVDLCRIHEVPYTEIKLETGQALTQEMLGKYDKESYTGLLVNLCETSTGVLYDLELINDFCIRKGMLLIVDAISAFMAEMIDMQKYGIDVLITGSQKALALPPGIAVMVLGRRAIERIENASVPSLYFNLKMALKDGERGQTPFTPAVSILIQLNKRLKMVDEIGINEELRRVKELAQDFRNKIAGLPLKLAAESPASSVTALMPIDGSSAYEIYTTLKEKYNIWVCPNGGALAERIFRVGHLGALTQEDNTTLVCALKEILNS